MTEFFSATGRKRPVRLSEATRVFASESLEHHKYGLDTRRTEAVILDGIEGFEALGNLEKYDRAVAEIAAKAPVRICPGERISGAATLGGAIGHVVPAKFGGQFVFGSVSHLTIDFQSVLDEGIDGIRARANAALERFRGTAREKFSQSCVNCLDSFYMWHGRYTEALSRLPGYEANLENLRQVPLRPPRNFCEAVQSIWFTFAFVRLCGNWPGIGRLDQLLGKYLKADLAEGRLTLDEAREILAHFFIKGCEWVSGGNYGSGDAQHYQNIVLGGVDAEGKPVTNEVTYLVLDIIEELGISDFPTTVRLGRDTDERLLRRVAEVIRYGGGVVAVYGEPLVLEALTRFGYSLSEARRFANDGCWEVQVPGATNFGYIPFDSLQILQKHTLGSYSADKAAEFPDFDTLFEKYAEDLTAFVRDNICAGFRDWRVPDSPLGPDPDSELPSTVVSIFERDCIGRGLSYFGGGTDYNVRSPHIGGFADTVGSLYAIKKLVYDDKKVTLEELFEALRANWEGYEPLRRYVSVHYTYFGNDSDEVDGLAARLIDRFSEACESQSRPGGFLVPAGVSTFGRQIEWAPGRLASPHGRRAKDVLAANCSPTPGSDFLGATAIVRSYCKCHLTRTVNGAALDIKLLPPSVAGEDGLQALIGLLRGFVDLGGYFMQLDVADPEVLKAAQEHPENYQTLSVRVSGWNARFVTLNKEWQDMIIDQTCSRQ